MALEIKELHVNLHMEKKDKTSQPDKGSSQPKHKDSLATEVAEIVLKILKEQQER